MLRMQKAWKHYESRSATSNSTVKTPRNLGDLQKKAKHLQDSTKRVAVGMMVKNLKEGTIKIVRTNHGTKEKIGLTKTIVRKEDLVGKKVEPEGITGKIQVEVVDLIEMIIEHMENEEGDLVMTIRVDDLAEIQNLEAVDSTEKMEEVDSTEKMEEVDSTEKMEEVDSTEKMEEVDLIRLTMTNLGEKEMTIQLIGEVLKTKMMVEVGKIETVLAVTKVVTVGKIGKIERVVVEAGIKIETVGKMAAVIGKADLIMMVVSRKVVLAESHQRKEAVSGNLGRKISVEQYFVSIKQKLSYHKPLPILRQRSKSSGVVDNVIAESRRPFALLYFRILPLHFSKHKNSTKTNITKQKLNSLLKKKHTKLVIILDQTPPPKMRVPPAEGASEARADVNERKHPSR
ncbi:hypothetical protein J6590_042393 [Homalodisca vitripennis]|nr:hypothetical protein J6590_042393 [Homalodisca vitripennis]